MIVRKLESIAVTKNGAAGRFDSSFAARARAERNNVCNYRFEFTAAAAAVV